MATDIKKVIENLLGFYDFDDKVIVSVGAGGGQLIEYGRNAKRVIALDNDAQAIGRLKEALERNGLAEKFSPQVKDFYEAELKGDVVLFEFCLHEMSDPARAIEHAKSMSNDVVVFDHLPGEWAHYINETEKVRRSWAAVEEHGFRKKITFEAVQSFKDHEELLNKVRSQGEESMRRIARFKTQENIAIKMPYCVALI